MFERHQNRSKYFEEQVITTRKYVVPFIEADLPLKPGMKVLEIGCGEGGNLMPFLERDCICVGVDINAEKIESGTQIFSAHEKAANITLITADIYTWNDAHSGEYDIIIMRDVIEHIPDQDRFMGYVKKFLKKDGLFFLGFPPWHNPFGGHQQICRSKVLSKWIWIHLFPNFIYRGLLKLFGEKQSTIDELMEIKSTGITLGRFEKICAKHQYQTKKVTWYFIQPNYEIKFGLKPRVAWNWVAKFPGLRNFFVTCGYYTIAK